VSTLWWANDPPRQAHFGGTVPVQLLRFFLVPQPLATRRLASGTSWRPCVSAFSRAPLEERFRHPLQAKLIHSSSPSRGFRAPAAPFSTAKTTKAVFGAHRPRPPQTPAPSF
jgi:hypothetical protein